MTRSKTEAQVLVLGGGPAGAAAARLLALWGRSVVVVERSEAGAGGASRGEVGAREADERSLAESLPPSSRKVLAATGLLGAVEAAGFHPNQGNTALWGGEGRRDDFAGGAVGFHVLRSRFDRVLRSAAADAGAQVVHGAARRPARIGDPSPGNGLTGEPPSRAMPSTATAASAGGNGWRAEVVRRDGSLVAVRAEWVLDCTGRSGLLGRRFRVAESEAPTLAVVRRYHARGGWPNVDGTHALVESFGRGWAWSVPTSPTDRHVAVMLDPSLGAITDRAGDVVAAFEAEIAATSLMRSVAGAAEPLGDAWAATASMYTSSAFAMERALLVGDAASFADPMSSYGVKKALASAWLAAVTVNTAIGTPALAHTAREFYAKREQAMYASLRDGLATQVEGVEGVEGTEDRAFWDRRAHWLADRSVIAGDANAPDGPDARALRDDPDVRAAFHALRLGSGRLRPLSRQTVDRPMVTGNRIRLAPALVTPRFPAGVRFFRDVDLMRVRNLAAGAANPGALYESYSDWAAREDLPPVDLANFIGVVALLIADGVLAPRAGSV